MKVVKVVQLCVDNTGNAHLVHSHHSAYEVLFCHISDSEEWVWLVREQEMAEHSVTTSRFCWEAQMSLQQYHRGPLWTLLWNPQSQWKTPKKGISSTAFFFCFLRGVPFAVAQIQRHKIHLAGSEFPTKQQKRDTQHIPSPHHTHLSWNNI